jgi:hypothetical protein
VACGGEVGGFVSFGYGMRGNGAIIVDSEGMLNEKMAKADYETRAPVKTVLN